MKVVKLIVLKYKLSSYAGIMNNAARSVNSHTVKFHTLLC